MTSEERATSGEILLRDRKISITMAEFEIEELVGGGELRRRGAITSTLSKKQM